MVQKTPEITRFERSYPEDYKLQKHYSMNYERSLTSTNLSTLLYQLKKITKVLFLTQITR